MALKITDGPLSAYVISGALGLPFITFFCLGLVHIAADEFSNSLPSLVLFGGLLGWVTFRLVSRRRARRKSE